MYVMYTDREAILGVYVAEALDVVEHQPRQRDHHQHDERDRNKQHRRPVKNNYVRSNEAPI